MAWRVKEQSAMSIEENKAIIRAFVDTWNRGDLDALAGLMAEDCQLSVSGQSISCAPANTRAIAAHWREAFPDYHFTLEDLIAEGNRVVARIPFAGTQVAPVIGIPSSEHTIWVDEIVIFRIQDGKIAEAWEVYDEYGMRRQLAETSEVSTD
jgi:steroid delta-isomerase-like uncharacterized protein